jgi:hypothetical protein
MAKTYWLRFGTDNPTNKTGLSPTLTTFANYGGSLVTGPAITEVPVGSGLYQFTYGPTVSMIFVCDGGAVLSSGDRYIVGALDPIQAVDEKVGTIADSYGSTSSDPSTVFGYLKRNQEVLEGDAIFTKSTGVWTIYSRGASTVLRIKTLTNTTSQATKA